MNILFVLYGDFSSNSAIPMALYARELSKAGHHCVITVPLNLETVEQHQNRSFTPVLYEAVLADPYSVFPDGRPADVIHACTPREYVRRFVTAYQSRTPTPLIIALEDNERWITEKAFDLDASSLNQFTNQELSEKLLDGLSHPGYMDSFTGLADSVVVIQNSLKSTVPPWVPCETVMIGIDLELFTPRVPDASLRKKYGLADHDKVIVYHGGLNKFVREAIKSLCVAVGVINQRGIACKLIRTGPMPLDFLDEISPEAKKAIIELGVISRTELPDLLALADVFVQPGSINAFEDLRLPGKVPEFLAMGKPVVMPNVNIAYLFKDNVNSILMETGTAQEIAEKCIQLFNYPDDANRIGRAGRALAEKSFDVRNQARALEKVYTSAIHSFNPELAKSVWQQSRKLNDTEFMLLTKLRLDIRQLTPMENNTCNHINSRYVELIEKSLERLQGLELRITGQNKEIIGQNKEIIGQNKQIIELNNQITEYKLEFQRLESKINSLEHHITGLNQQLDSVFASTSWKMTRPIRLLKKLFDKYLH